MSELHYFNPAQNLERGESSMHVIEVREGDEVIGGADIEYFSSPVPFYQVSDLWISHEHHGEGHGSKVMDYIEKMLKQKGKAGFLVDAIDANSPAKGMYERRGWQRVPDSLGQYVFNLPKGVKPDIFQNVQYRGEGT